MHLLPFARWLKLPSDDPPEFLVLLVGTLAFLGVRRVKRVKAPQRTITTGKETMAYLQRSREHA